MTNKLKNLILKRCNSHGLCSINVDGDIVTIFDKKYYVNLLNEEVEEV